MVERKPIEAWLTDMDGVLIHEGTPIPGAAEFISKLREFGRPFLVLTNNSIYTQRDLQARLARMGLDIPAENIWTSALATAKFLSTQRPGGTAYVIGEAGLTTALHDVGYVLTDSEPDFCILGEPRTTKTCLALTCGLLPSVVDRLLVGRQREGPPTIAGGPSSYLRVRPCRSDRRWSRPRGSAGRGSAPRRRAW